MRPAAVGRKLEAGEVGLVIDVQPLGAACACLLGGPLHQADAQW